MKEIFIQANNLTDAYHLALTKMKIDGDYVECSDGSHLLECGMTTHIENPIAEPRISRLIVGGAYDLMRYVLEITDGILDFEIGRNWAYTYHSRIASQIQFVINELERDPSSKRAVINVRDNTIDMYSENPACLQHLHFFIREGRLCLKVLFRSNDLCKAYFLNSFAIVKLQEIIAENLNIPVGNYTHRSNSMHVYEKDFGFLDGCVKRICNFKNHENLFYNYEGFFKEQMEDEIPKIMELVENQKRKYGIE